MTLIYFDITIGSVFIGKLIFQLFDNIVPITVEVILF